MGRRRKQTITYDSKETRTVLGLLSLLLSLTLFIAAIVETTDNNFFTQAKFIFGQTTPLAGLFFFDLGLNLLQVDWPLSNKLSVFAQLLLMFLVPAFITSLQPSKSAAILARDRGLAGGSLGYYVAYELFADTLVFAQYTPLILGGAVLIFVPLALSMSVSTLFSYIEAIVGWIIKAVNALVTKPAKGAAEAAADQIIEKASRFSDFQRDTHDDDQKEPAYEKTKNDTMHSDIPPMKAKRPTEEVAFTETEIGEDGLAFSELKYAGWQLPPLSLLSPYRKTKATDVDRERNSKIIEQTLLSFNVDAKVMDAYTGPSVVQYALDIPLGTKVSKITTLNENIALALGVDSKAVRIETIPGTTYLGIEVPRSKRDEVLIREIAESPDMRNTKFNLPVTVGKDINGKAIIADVQKMPHLLIAGATGSGKSILTNSFIVSMLLTKTPDELRLILVDPKQVELSDYNGIPHLLTPVITDMDKVVNALKWSVTEMEKRYSTLNKAQVRNIEGYNQKMGFAAMPYIVIVIDEMADMMMTANRVEAETAIVRLAQKARAVGIHLVLATQRPSVNVITGLIKANIPARIGMSVTSGIDSRVIMDDIGAESLMGRGDLLYKAPDKTKSSRLQGSFVSQEEVVRVVNFIKSQVPEVEYAMSILEGPNAGVAGTTDGLSMSDDDLFVQAVRVVVNYQKGSSSFLQRKLNIGFNRAARLLEEMEERGIVGPSEGSKPREVLITDADEYFSKLQGH